MHKRLVALPGRQAAEHRRGIKTTTRGTEKYQCKGLVSFSHPSWGGPRTAARASSPSDRRTYTRDCTVYTLVSDRSVLVSRRRQPLPPLARQSRGLAPPYFLKQNVPHGKL